RSAVGAPLALGALLARSNRDPRLDMILFVAIGDVPPHVPDALAQARRADPDSPIVLLQERAPRALRGRAHALRVDLADLAPLRRDDRWVAFDRRRDGRRRFRQG